MITINQKGFTLIESVISLMIFFIIFACVGQLTFNSVKWHSTVVSNQEVFENARISIDFMVNQIRQAQQIQLTTASGTFKKLKLYSSDASTPYDYFSFSKNTLNYGGNNGSGEKANELASSLEDVQVSLSDDKKFMKLQVKGEGVTLTRILNLKYKTVK